MVVTMINSVNLNSIQNIYAAPVNKEQKLSADKNMSFGASKTEKQYSPVSKPVVSLRTKMNNNEEKIYKSLLNNLDKPSRKQLEALLKRGILLNSDSGDKSTVLDNLYKISSTPRAQGLSSKVILQSAIETLENPFKSTQTFGDIPKEFKQKAIDAVVENKSSMLEIKKAENDINVKTSGSCPAASIEFTMAQKNPAEFTRFVEGLTSVNMSVEKEIKLSNLADSTLDAVWLLNAFEIPYEMKDFDKAVLKFAPDKNAIIRAQIQTKYKDPMERSVVDVLMQSTLMNVGSQQTYNSLTDKRAGKFSSQDTGLIEFEKTFTESVVSDKNKITLTNQKLDDNGKLIGYESDFETLKKQLLDTIKAGENIIIGYTFIDKNNDVVGGHEITIVGARQDKDGKTYFICNDSDDDYFGAVEYCENDLLPLIHHATFPKEIVENDVHFNENWVEGLRNFKELKNHSQAA